MSIMNVVVVLVAVVAVLNLVLTMGVIRRLREQQGALAALRRHEQRLPSVGAVVTDFDTVDADGRRLSHRDLTGPALVGFFTPGCEPCRALLPRFVAELADSGRRGVAVIVTEPGEDDTEYRQSLARVARVVIERPHGTVQRAVGTDVYPTIVALDEHLTVTASGTDEAALRAARAVPAGT